LAISRNGRIQQLPLRFRQQEQSNDTSEHFNWFLMLEMDSFTLNTTIAYDFVIFDGSWATNQLSTANLHLSVLQHRNWRVTISGVEPDDYEVAKLYFEYWSTTDYTRLYFDPIWFFTDSQQRTNCPRRAFIFPFYNKAIWKPPVRLLILTTTKPLSFISNIDGPQVVACHLKYHSENNPEITDTSTECSLDSDLTDGS